MKTLFLTFLFLLSLCTNAQIVEASTTIATNEYMDLLTANLELPKEVTEKYANQDIELTIVLTITKDGSVFNPKIQNDSLQLEPYLKKAVETLPKWNPKTEDGNPVVSRKAFKLIIPILYAIQEDDLAMKANPEGGMQGYYHNFMRKVNVDKYLDDEATVSGIKMIATFVVEKDGNLTNIKIIESNEPSLNSEIIRVIKSMPKWNPATENGVPVRSDFTLPIKIKFNR
ncbi:energy transducer TonB [Flavobacterium dauae]|uniref:energy transducer TonB n=1 Tax=Flavobacterium dauae TaxID=1563479 RepID=UPI00101B449A|nr:energy transducer TonB [Flavobacterium dauae]WLD24467.1 energy transducer TonB [Flavobacterium dauae]